MKILLSFALKNIILFFFLFILHRYLSLSVLSENLDLATIGLTKVFAVGLMSDFWIATMIATAFLLISLIAYFFKTQETKIKRFNISMQFLIAIMTVLHLGYIHYFRHSIIPFHLNYLLDFDFIKANYQTTFELRNILLFIFCSLIIYLYNRFFQKTNLTKTQLALINFLMIVLAVVFHVLNIHYRIQWFIPDQLQMNYIEKLHANLKYERRPSQLSSSEISILQNIRQVDSSQRNLFQLLSFQQTNSDSKIFQSIKNLWNQKVTEQKKPILLTIVAESLREIDLSLESTPNYLKYANSGIRFTNTWSSGTVTRGGQEAVWCGYPGSVSNSTMRNRTEIKLNCLPKISQGNSFWLHGGEGRFDSQVDYWKNQQVESITSQINFPADAPKTGWGISDFYFFNTASNKLQTLHQSFKKDFSVGMILSVSNHIPWDLPMDAPRPILEAENVHSSFKTVKLFDASLGAFFENLKKNGLWDQMFIVVIGDHGNYLEPLNQEIKKPNLAKIANVALLMTGGGVESALKDLNVQNHVENKFSSQQDLAGFYLELLGLDEKILAENIFNSKRHFPIVSDLGDKIYLPESDTEISIGKILNTNDSNELPIVYYKALMHLMNNWKEQKNGQ